MNQSWAAPERGRGQLSPCPPAVPSAGKILMVIVHSGNHTHSKVWLIKRHFCNTTQISVIFLRFKISNNGKFAASVACPKPNSVSASRGKGASLPDQGLSPLIPLHLFYAHNNGIGSTFGPTHKQIVAPLCPASCLLPVVPQLQIPSAAHETNGW